MTGYKTIASATIAIHYVYQIHQQGVLSRPETGKVRFTERRRKLVGQQDGQGKKQHNKPHLTHGIVLDQHIK